MCGSSFIVMATSQVEIEHDDLFSAINNASFTMKKSEHLAFLLSLVARDSEHDQEIKGIAALELKEKFIPEGAIYKWKKSNFLSTEDMIEFVNTRDDGEIQSWLKPREIEVIGKSTKNFTLQIKRSELVNMDHIGVEGLNVGEVIRLIEEKIKSKGLGITKLEGIDILQPHGFSEWIAVGLYIDANAEYRMTALINKETVIFDRPKEIAGW